MVEGRYVGADRLVVVVMGMMVGKQTGVVVGTSSGVLDESIRVLLLLLRLWGNGESVPGTGSGWIMKSRWRLWAWLLRVVHRSIRASQGIKSVLNREASQTRARMLWLETIGGDSSLGIPSLLVQF